MIPNVALRVLYWLLVLVTGHAFTQGAAHMLSIPPGLGFVALLALAWRPLGLLFLIPISWDGATRSYEWPFLGAGLFALLPLLPVLALDNWRAFRRAPDTTLGPTP